MLQNMTVRYLEVQESFLFVLTSCNTPTVIILDIVHISALVFSSLPTWLRNNQYQKFRSLPKLFQAPEMAAIRP